MGSERAVSRGPLPPAAIQCRALAPSNTLASVASPGRSACRPRAPTRPGSRVTAPTRWRSAPRTALRRASRRPLRSPTAAPRRTARAQVRHHGTRSRGRTPAAPARPPPTGHGRPRRRDGRRARTASQATVMPATTGAAHEHRQRPAFLGLRRLAPQHHFVQCEREPADDGEQVEAARTSAEAEPGHARRRRRTALGTLRQHEGRADQRAGHASDGRARQRLVQHHAREQQRPQRHQVEQQHDADDVADAHRPVERRVGRARGDEDQPQRRLPSRPGEARRGATTRSPRPTARR